jgi:hypothetical protein
MKRKKIFILIGCLHFIFFYEGVGTAIAQNYPDAGSWNTFNVEYGINSRFTGLFAEECRVKENFSRLNLFYTNIGIEYKATKYFKAALIYRFIDKYQEDNSFSFRHRLMLDLTLKRKFGKFGLSYRQRLQAEEKDIYSSDDGRINEWYSRNKFAVKYDLDKPYKPYVSVELRYQVYNPRKIESDQTWHRVRYVAGVDYKLNNKNTIGVYYLIQREWNVPDPQHQYIVGLEYTLSL